MRKTVIITQGVNHLIKSLLSSNEILIAGIVESAPAISSRKKSHYKLKKSILNLLNRIPFRNSLYIESKKRGIPFFFLDKFNFILFDNWLKKINPELVLVYSMSQLIPDYVLNNRNYKFINLHPSLLPSYRGPNPWFWVVYNMETQSGLTLHYIDKGEDTGDIISQVKFDIPIPMNSESFQKIILENQGKELVLNFIRKFNAGEHIESIKQPEKSPTKRARGIKKNQHTKIINFQEFSVYRIWHILCSTKSWLYALPPPNFFYSGQRYRAMRYERKTTKGFSPGNIYKSGKEYILECKDGIIYLKLKWSFKDLLIYLYRRFL
ncbi:MAG TPA: formyltransferase family protein [Ignavibacteria bacterium]|nr:formyltransferase family protein [Ignavibacteria bacterium]